MSFGKIILALIWGIILYQPGFADWTRQDSGTLSWLYSVYFVDKKTGWIAGSAGTILSTIDGGLTWKNEQKFTRDKIRDIYFADRSNGWALCERDGFNSEPPAYLMRTADGGSSWKKQELNTGHKRMVRFLFVPGGEGIAFGEGGSVIRFWAGEERAESLPVSNLIFAGKFVDEQRGVLAGTGRTLLVTENGGMTWTVARVSGGSIDARLSSVVFVNERMGWAVGNRGALYYTANSGRSWSARESNTTEDLTDIGFADQATGFTVGDKGIMLQTDDGGETWQPTSRRFTNRLERVVFIGNKGFAVGSGGIILRYSLDNEVRAEGGRRSSITK